MRKIAVAVLLFISLVFLWYDYGFMPDDGMDYNIEVSELSEETNESATENETSFVEKKTDMIEETKPIQATEETSVPIQEEIIEPEEIVLKCTLSVNCNTILDNIEKLKEEKRGLVPENGVIYPATEVEFKDGESVFDVLLRSMKEKHIHLEFVNTPMYSSIYIEGINNLYQRDCGDMSGWQYRVNGEFPNTGCSQYKLKQGDVVEWLYTCNFGKDL